MKYLCSCFTFIMIFLSIAGCGAKGTDTTQSPKEGLDVVCNAFIENEELRKKGTNSNKRTKILASRIQENLRNEELVDVFAGFTDPTMDSEEKETMFGALLEKYQYTRKCPWPSLHEKPKPKEKSEQINEGSFMDGINFGSDANTEDVVLEAKCKPKSDKELSCDNVRELMSYGTSEEIIIKMLENIYSDSKIAKLCFQRCFKK